MINEDLKVLTKNSGKNVIELDSEPEKTSESELEEMRLRLVNEIRAAQKSKKSLSLQPSQVSIDQAELSQDDPSFRIRTGGNMNDRDLRSNPPPIDALSQNREIPARILRRDPNT